MQLFELVSPRLFRPLAGPNRAFYAELLLLLWEECRHTADTAFPVRRAVWRAEDYFAPLASPLRWMPTVRAMRTSSHPRPSHAGRGLSAAAAAHRLAGRTAGSYEEEPALAFVPEVTPLLEALEEILEPPGRHLHWQALQGVAAFAERGPREEPLRERPAGGSRRP